MENKMNLLEKVAEARVRLGESKINKSGHNNHANFDYFQLDDFMPTARKICRELRFLPVESFGSDKAVMTVRDFDSDAVVQFECPVSLPKIPGANDTQMIGGMITYLRRYLWMMLFEITEPDEFDADQQRDEPKASGWQRNATTRGTRAASEAAPKDERPATQPKATAQSLGTKAWKKTLEHFGYSFDKPKTDRDNTDAFNAALEFVKPYGIKQAEDMKTLADDIAGSITQRLANMENTGGPEMFEGDELPA